MSTGLELIPIAMAIGAVVAARKASHGSLNVTSEMPVQTLSSRMRDEKLLRSAVDSLGEVFGTKDGAIFASAEGRAVVFTRADDGTFDVHLERALALEEAQDVVRRLDVAYGLCVQQQVYERVTAHASEFGLELESERIDTEDDTIVVTLRVVQGMA